MSPILPFLAVRCIVLFCKCFKASSFDSQYCTTRFPSRLYDLLILTPYILATLILAHVRLMARHTTDGMYVDKILVYDAGRQYNFCQYHVSKFRPSAVRSVCGSQPNWWKSLRFWELWETRDFALVLYKPGAAKLNHWTLPHRFLFSLPHIIDAQQINSK